MGGGKLSHAVEFALPQLLIPKCYSIGHFREFGMISCVGSTVGVGLGVPGG